MNENDVHVGFTGTQDGMTQLQQLRVEQLLQDSHPLPTILHHGDCVGADADFHEIVREQLPTSLIEGHPPLNDSKRAWCEFDIINEEKDYLDRNKDIVDASSFMIAAPSGPEKLRSGTWSTIRYARKQNKFVFVVLPDGSIDGKPLLRKLEDEN